MTAMPTFQILREEACSRLGYTIEPATSAHAYKDTAHKWINYTLRQGDYQRPGRMHEKGRAEFEIYMANLLDLMGPCSEDTVLWRGASVERRILRSRQVSDPAFLSTSLCQKQAGRFTSKALGDNRRDTAPVMFRIIAPRAA